jgi:predicted dehydrogenase
LDTQQLKASTQLGISIAKRRLNAGFIGVGNFVAGNHLPNIAHSNLWHVHTLCDVNSASLQRQAEKYQPDATTTDYRQLLADPEIDVVILGVRHKEHVPFIQAAACAGKHILVEKPMSMTLPEAQLIIDAVQQANVKLMVGYNRRFGPLYVKAKELFQKVNRGKRAMITFRAVADDRLWPRWPFDVNDGGGLVISECCHFFDFLAWFLEDEPVRIFCEGQRETDNIITIRFASGSVGCIISGGDGNVCYPKERLEVFSGHSTLVVDHCLELHVENYPDSADASWPLKDDAYPQVGVGLSPIHAFRQKMRKWARQGVAAEDLKRGAYYGSIPDVHKGHFQEIEAFADAILEGKPSPCDEIDGARATACCQAAVRSMEEGFIPVDIHPENYFLVRRRAD